METETVAEAQTGAAEEAQPTGGEDHSTDTHQEGGEAAQPTGGEKPSGDSAPSKGKQLAELLERQKKNPNVVFNDAELDILDEHYAGKLRPDATDDETPAGEEGQGEDPQPDEKPQGVPDPDVASVMKAVGAKTLKDLLPKVKDLQKQLTGKDAQANAQLRKDLDALGKRAQNEDRLWKDAKSGNPAAVAHALAHVEKVYGLKLVVAGQAGAPSTGTSGAAAAPADLDLEEVIPKELFVDEESHKKANGFLRGIAQKAKDLEAKYEGIESERTRIRQESARESARAGAIDEMVTVAGLPGFEALAKTPNLRQAIDRWYTKGEENPVLEALQPVLDIANEFEIPLSVACEILRGRGHQVEVAAAESRGRKSAYEQKPTRSLSGMQGKGQDQYQKHSDEQLKEMAEDYTKAPPEWFGADDRPNHKTIPKRAWKHFFSPEEIAAF